MGKVVSSASMSLDGYIAPHDNHIGRLFDWYDSGDVVVETAMPGLTFHLSPPSAQYVRGWTTSLGALVGTVTVGKCSKTPYPACPSSS